MKNVCDMEVFELSRWSALYEAVNFIADECEERGRDFNTIKLEPLGIRKYVESTSDIFARRIEAENTKQEMFKQYTANEMKKLQNRKECKANEVVH